MDIMQGELIRQYLVTTQLQISITIITVIIRKVKSDHRSKVSNLSNWKEEA